MSTPQTEAEKKAATVAAEAAADATRKAAEADAADAARVKADAEAAEAAAKKPAKKKASDALVAVHRIVYGKNQVAVPGSFLRASDLRAADLEFLTESGAVREPNEAEAVVAEAALNDPIG